MVRVECIKELYKDCSDQPPVRVFARMDMEGQCRCFERC